MKIGERTFMNLQEAVGWLLENNALPFQSTTNYVGNTEIAMSTLINPSPAKVRIGSLIFFDDSKVSTVVGVTSNSFIVSDQYNDLVDDVVYISNVELRADGHLIVTLSNGNTVDAGLVKQINSMTINASLQLVVNYNDGTSSVVGSLGDFSNVDFEAKTIESINANFISSLGVYITSCEVTDYYSKIIISNKIMYLVLNFKFKNITSAPITLYNLGTIYINVPSKYAEKVYDLNGHTAHDADISNCLITLFKGFICNDINGSNQHELLFSLSNAPSADQIVINPIEASGITLDVNEEKFVTGRIMLTLY